jgi:hypothetical protein
MAVISGPRSLGFAQGPGTTLRGDLAHSLSKPLGIQRFLHLSQHQSAKDAVAPGWYVLPNNVPKLASN